MSLRIKRNIYLSHVGRQYAPEVLANNGIILCFISVLPNMAMFFLNLLKVNIINEDSLTQYDEVIKLRK